MNKLFDLITPKELIGAACLVAGIFAIQWVLAHVIVKVAGY